MPPAGPEELVEAAPPSTATSCPWASGCPSAGLAGGSSGSLPVLHSQACHSSSPHAQPPTSSFSFTAPFVMVNFNSPRRPSCSTFTSLDRAARVLVSQGHKDRHIQHCILPPCQHGGHLRSAHRAGLRPCKQTHALENTAHHSPGIPLAVPFFPALLKQRSDISTGTSVPFHCRTPYFLLSGSPILAFALPPLPHYP